jgi:hypothetical protein
LECGNLAATTTAAHRSLVTLNQSVSQSLCSFFFFLFICFYLLLYLLVRGAPLLCKAAAVLVISLLTKYGRDNNNIFSSSLFPLPGWCYYLISNVEEGSLSLLTHDGTS